MRQTSLIIFGLVLLIIVSGCAGGGGSIDLDADGYGTTTLKNGMTVIINHDETTSLSAGRIIIGGGVLSETAENNGITNLMIRMLLKGNNKMSASEVSEKLDFFGAQVNAMCDDDLSSISFVALTENFDAVFEIISASLLYPTFPEEELTKLKTEVEGNIKSSDDNQQRASSKLFYETAFGNSGYGLPTLGKVETIADITVDDLKEHYDRYVGGSNMIFSISTDMPTDLVTEIIDKYLARLKAEAKTAPELAHKLMDAKDGFVSFDRNQSFIYTGYPMANLTDREVVYLHLINEIMGSNVGSRLWFLRQKEKLAYTVYTHYSLNKHSTIFRAAIGTDTTKVGQALSSLDRELKLLVNDGITDAELTDAKINMKNSLIYRIDTKGNRTNNMGYYEHIGYGYDFVPRMFKMIDGVTIDEVNNFIAAKFDESQRFTSIVGKR